MTLGEKGFLTGMILIFIGSCLISLSDLAAIVLFLIGIALLIFASSKGSKEYGEQ